MQMRNVVCDEDDESRKSGGGNKSRDDACRMSVLQLGSSTTTRLSSMYDF